MFDSISDNHVFEEEDEQKFNQLISDMTDWMNKYASLYDDPDTIMDHLEVPETQPIVDEEPVQSSSPIVSAESPKPQEQAPELSTEVYIEYQYPGM